MEEQYEFNKIMNAFESKGIQPSEREKQILIRKLNRLKDEILFAQNLIKRIDKAL